MRCGPDGGGFVPLDGINAQEVPELMNLSRNRCIAQVLNRLFDTEFNGLDIELCIGRSAARLRTIGQRATAGECWYNAEGTFSSDVERLAKLLGGAHSAGWNRIAITAAVLCGLLAQMGQEGRLDAQGVDFAVPTGDLCAVMSAWYVRSWGFPIRNIIACCGENSGFWELVHYGVLRTAGVAQETVLPEGAWVIPEELERLVYHCGGVVETADYLEQCRTGRPYCPAPSTQKALQDSLRASVVSDWRLADVITGVYRSSGYILSLSAAAAFAGLQDYRAKSGTYAPALILAERNPENELDVLSQILHTPRQVLKGQLI